MFMMFTNMISFDRGLVVISKLTSGTYSDNKFGVIIKGVVHQKTTGMSWNRLVQVAPITDIFSFGLFPSECKLVTGVV